MSVEKIYRTCVNGFVFSFSQQEIEEADLVQISPNKYHFLKDYQSISAEITSADLNTKTIQVEIEGETYTVVIKTELDQVLEKMGFNAGKGKQHKEIKAPMPGLVLSIAVTEGQQVIEGDKILILEAMKMENNIMTHANARISRIAVKEGQAVEKGQMLVELE
ncbi:MAG TPA: biotin/lipoyl-binding protein [Chitinophagaceae bacterium]|nr:biotin/lipoyl-binding protein [Chitinophagaceae bacterium]